MQSNHDELAQAGYDASGGEAAISLEFLINWSDDKGAGWRTTRQAIEGRTKGWSLRASCPCTNLPKLL